MARAHNITADHARKERWKQHHAEPEKWFWSRVDRKSDEECWPWLGRVANRRGGYGRLMFQGRLTGAHRMALTLAKGEGGADKHACHQCDNPICCNPAHLFWGTPLENTRDCLAKGRRRAPHARKIDRDEAARLHAEGWSYSRLAKRYSVNQASIGKALRARASLIEEERS